MIRATLIALLLASPAAATPWTVPDGEGGWKPNPDCSSATCHETGNPDPEPKPEPPAKPTRPDHDGEGRSAPAATVPAFRTCCVHAGQHYATPRLFRSRRAASEACAAMVNPPACFPLSDPAPYTGPLK